MVLTVEQYNQFMKRVIKTDTCWLWWVPYIKGLPSRIIIEHDATQEEYGKLYGAYAHRLALSYHLQRDLLPGTVVRHLCKTKNCVNPEHLTEGTHTENMRDKIRDGTSKYKRLSEDAVRAIRYSDEPQRLLSKRYKIALQAISDIQCKRRWKHIYGPTLPPPTPQSSPESNLIQLV